MSKPSKVLKNIKYPKIGTPPVYEGFIKAFLAMPGNKKIFATIDKSTLDAEYERQLRADSRLSDSGVTRCLEEVRGPERNPFRAKLTTNSVETKMANMSLA